MSGTALDHAAQALATVERAADRYLVSSGTWKRTAANQIDEALAVLSAAMANVEPHQADALEVRIRDTADLVWAHVQDQHADRIAVRQWASRMHTIARRRGEQ